MSERIAPCPFCGSEGRIIHRKYGDLPVDWSWEVICGDEECGAIGPTAETEPKAISRWNERAE